MAFRNPQSGYYYTEKRLSAYGVLPRRSLGTKRKGDAKKLENALVEVDRLSVVENADYLGILATFAEGRLPAAQILQALHTQALGSLVRSLQDEPFRIVYARYFENNKARTQDQKVGHLLLRYIKEDTWNTVCDAAYITDLFHRIQVGQGGTKTITTKQGKKTRDRYIWIAPSLLPAVCRYWDPTKPDDPLFSLSATRYHTIFKEAVCGQAWTARQPMTHHCARTVLEVSLPCLPKKNASTGHSSAKASGTPSCR